MPSILSASTADFISIGSRLVGATFLWTGIIKAIEPHTFMRHLTALGWIPRKYMAPAITAAAGLEAGLGVALLVNMSPGLLSPLTIVLLLALTAMAVWGVRSGKTSDCGCYGGYIQPSISQSVALNAGFASLVALSWLSQARATVPSSWQVAVVVVAIVTVGGIAHSAQAFSRRTGHPKFDTNPLKVGRRWKHSLAAGATSKLEGEVFVSYLGPDCPHCTKWVKVLNAMHQSAALPSVVGVVAAPPARVDSFIADHGIRFPVARVSPTLIGRVVHAYPTTVAIKSGKISERWEGTAPPDFVDRFRRAFFPGADALVKNSAS